MKNSQYKSINILLNFLDYEYNEEKCKSVYSRINSTGFLKFILHFYLNILNLFSNFSFFINLNKNFILFKFLTGIVILVFESENESFVKKIKNEVNTDLNKIYDIAVVGSGPGGSIASLRSLERGKSVVLIESGAKYLPGTIKHHSLDQTTKQFKKQGLNFCYGNIPMLFTEGETYGGGSEVNSGLYFKLTEPYRSTFLKKCNIEEDEWQHFEKIVEQKISVQKSPKGSLDNIKSALLDGSKNKGLVCEEVPRWRSYEPVEEHKSMQVTYLKESEEKDIDIFTESKVIKILPKKDYIEIITISKNKKNSIRAKNIVLSAGTIGTPQILKNSGLIKDKLYFNFHPMNRAVVEYKEVVNGGDLFPPLQAWTSDYIYKFGYSVSTYPYVKATLASFGKTKKLPKEGKLVSYFSSTVLENSNGRLLNIFGNLIPICYISKEDRKKIKKGFSILLDLLKSTNINDIWPKSEVSPMTTVHVFGSIPLGISKDIGELGELAKDNRIKICDASLLPQAPWGNPQAVVMVLNEILMNKWLDKNF